MKLLKCSLYCGYFVLTACGMGCQDLSNNSQPFFGAPMGAAGSSSGMSRGVGGNGFITELPINGWIDTSDDRLSTFAADADTGSYTLARQQIRRGLCPSASLIRPEEFINYFSYNYASPPPGQTFRVVMDGAPLSGSSGTTLLRIGIQGQRVAVAEREPMALILLVDVSGSMSESNKLPLAMRALDVLLNNLLPEDLVSLVSYASSTRVVLGPTRARERAKIQDAIAGLQADGSTAMGDGLQLAYEQAQHAKSLGAAKARILLLSDGDTNVGARSPESILDLIGRRALDGVFLSTLGFGMGNYRDDMMERLADRGNGSYYYIDSFTEAKRVFEAEVTGTLSVIAKDLKIQVDFDQSKVAKYRLIGYENRDVADEDFRNDLADAGDLGAGHSVTALYELKLVEGATGELLKIRLRYKEPADEKQVIESIENFFVHNIHPSMSDSPRDMCLAFAVASFSQTLRAPEHGSAASLRQIRSDLRALATPEKAADAELELMQLITQAEDLC